jgi:hypothetical protein
VNDIIFGGSSHVVVSSFLEMMEEFQMSTMGELTFFLDIQVKQMKQATFIHQAKYTNGQMKKFNMADLKPVSTSMSMATTLDPDENGEVIDQREYKSIIGSLLYLIASRSDIQFAVCLCPHFLASPHSSHQTPIPWTTSGWPVHGSTVDATVADGRGSPELGLAAAPSHGGLP